MFPLPGNRHATAKQTIKLPEFSEPPFIHPQDTEQPAKPGPPPVQFVVGLVKYLDECFPSNSATGVVIYLPREALET